jgi:hypothetical protein
VLLPPRKQLGVAVWQVPISAASSALLIVAVIGLPVVPPVTVIPTVTVDPCVIFRQFVIPAGVPPGHALNGASVSDVEVGVKVPTAEGQPFIRLVTLIDPSPVAKSYPVPVANPRVPLGTLLLLRVSNTPILVEPTVVMLQLKVAAKHGTELFPFTTSLKTQVDAGTREELQFASFCAADIAYRTKFALPCRPDSPLPNMF